MKQRQKNNMWQYK